jgi:hypothetical protein
MTNTADTDRFYVEIIAYDDDATIKRIGPMTERKADQVEDGVNINLDHDRYYTRLTKDPTP